VLIEPGRSLVGNAGVCLTEVLYLKPGEQKNFCIVDAAMNDLPRPAMYQAFHRIVPLQRGRGRGRLRRGRPGVRKRRLARARPPAGGAAGRPAGGAVGRRLLHEHGQQLQHPPARGRVLVDGASASLMTILLY
jgi:hypothetical protein